MKPSINQKIKLNKFLVDKYKEIEIHKVKIEELKKMKNSRSVSVLPEIK